MGLGRRGTGRRRAATSRLLACTAGVLVLAASAVTGSAAAASTGSTLKVIALAPAASAPPSTPATGASPSRHGPDPLRPAPPVAHGRGGARWDAPRFAQQTLNWSGEMATRGGYTSVSGDWTVPSVTTSTSSRDSATWIGIGGGSGSATGLIQTGTDQHTSTGVATYSAWYEILPTASVPIVNPTTHQPVPVVPGDRMQAEIAQQSGTRWLIQIKDLTQGWVAQGTFAYTGTTATAEWIEEAPSLNTSIETLADFQSVRFSAMRDSAGTSTTLTALQMVNRGGSVIADPGPVSPSTTRSVTVYYGASASTPPATTPPATTPPATTPPATTPPATTPPATTPPATTPPAASASTGYDLVGADGGVFVFDPPGKSGGFFGSLPGIHVSPAKPIVGMVATAGDKGYFLVGADGGVFAFGDAPFLGSLPGEHVVPAQPITGIVAASTDHGYFLVGRDGGVFSFGSVPFLGSLPGEGIHVDDIVGIAATPTGNGYWLVAATGKVYAFGAAKQFGTAPASASPVAAVAGTATGGGYWVATQDGAVFTLGNARRFGTLPSIRVAPVQPVIAIVETSGTGGYWLVARDGGIFAFGDAPFIGALPSLAHVTDIVGAVATSV